MDGKNKLKCPCCGQTLHLCIGFDGCDWDTVAGGGSGYDYPISLGCPGCGRGYIVGRLKDGSAFSESVEGQRPYAGSINDYEEG